ncbi:MAG: cyclase family protein [Gemmatimonadaceae bacterium]
MRVGSVICAALLAACAPSAEQGTPLDLARVDIVDLTHPLSPQTLFWPTSPSGFEHIELHAGPTARGWYYSAYAFAAPEHGGTHLDAPVHFAEGGLTTELIPLTRLVAPAIVIDVSAKAAGERDYRLTSDDIAAFEAAHGQIPPGSVVLLRTGWDAHWGDRMAYFGDTAKGDASRLHFPGYGVAAARLLVEERRVAGLGIDSPSVDYGPSLDFEVHRVGAPRGVYNLENLTSLGRVPPRGAVLIAAPMKIQGGSGGPVRAIALVPKDMR